MFAAPAVYVEIKIGTMYDTTGGLASYATGFEYAVNQAFTDLNAMDDGYHFVNVYADSGGANGQVATCLLYTSPSPRDATLSRMPSSA